MTGPRPSDIAALLVACAATIFGCGKSTFCSGPDILCQNFSLASCAQVSGCTPGPACIVADGQSAPCSSFSDSAQCPSPKCAFSNGTCVSICGQHTARADCELQQSATADMYGFPTWICSWAECVGTPKTMFCDEFSKDMCPADLGCSVQQVCSFGDC